MSSPANTLKGLQLFQQAQQLQHAGRLAEAADAFARAASLLPDHPDLLAAYAGLAEAARDFSAAEKLYHRLLRVRPQADIAGRLAGCLYRLDRCEEAVPLLRAHRARHPDDMSAALTLGLALFRLRRWEEALVAGRELEEKVPGETSMDIVLNALFNLGDKSALDALVERAMTQYADSILIMSVCVQHLMKTGDYARAFAYPHAVRMRYKPGAKGIDQPPPHWWDGAPFDGVLLVSGKQGIGDEILSANMFTELVRLREQTGQQVLIECDARLLPLFRRSFPALEFVGRNADESLPTALAGKPYRMIKALDLTYYFRRQTPLPPQAPWLVADPVRVATLRARYRGVYPARRIAGISWKSRREYATGPDKSTALTDLAALLTLPDYVWMNVQYGDVVADLASVSASGVTPPLIDAEIDPTDDIDALAAQLLALDVVVSTSNTTAHLAGALGAPCHLLLPKARPVLWYWGYEGVHTPWYPSITIHRNALEDEWRALAGDVARQLAKQAPEP